MPPLKSLSLSFFFNALTIYMDDTLHPTVSGYTTNLIGKQGVVRL